MCAWHCTRALSGLGKPSPLIDQQMVPPHRQFITRIYRYCIRFVHPLIYPMRSRREWKCTRRRNSMTEIEYGGILSITQFQCGAKNSTFPIQTKPIHHSYLSHGDERLGTISKWRLLPIRSWMLERTDCLKFGHTHGIFAPVKISHEDYGSAKTFRLRHKNYMYF